MSQDTPAEVSFQFAVANSGDLASHLNANDDQPELLQDVFNSTNMSWASPDFRAHRKREQQAQRAKALTDRLARPKLTTAANIENAASNGSAAVQSAKQQKAMAALAKAFKEDDLQGTGSTRRRSAMPSGSGNASMRQRSSRPAGARSSSITRPVVAVKPLPAKANDTVAKMILRSRSVDRVVPQKPPVVQSPAVQAARVSRSRAVKAATGSHVGSAIQAKPEANQRVKVPAKPNVAKAERPPILPKPAAVQAKPVTIPAKPAITSTPRSRNVRSASVEPPSKVPVKRPNPIAPPPATSTSSTGSSTRRLRSFTNDVVENAKKIAGFRVFPRSASNASKTSGVAATEATTSKVPIRPAVPAPRPTNKPPAAHRPPAFIQKNTRQNPSTPSPAEVSAANSSTSQIPHRRNSFMAPTMSSRRRSVQPVPSTQH